MVLRQTKIRYSEPTKHHCTVPLELIPTLNSTIPTIILTRVPNREGVIPTWHRRVGREGHRHGGLHRVGQRTRGTRIRIRWCCRLAAAAGGCCSRSVATRAGRQVRWRRPGRRVVLTGGPGRFNRLLLVVGGCSGRRLYRHAGKTGGKVLPRQTNK